jgi:hypothetical protein
MQMNADKQYVYDVGVLCEFTASLNAQLLFTRFLSSFMKQQFGVYALECSL